MNTEDMIRKYLMLHPDSFFDMTKYEFPLRIVQQILEDAVKAEREECAKVCDNQMEWGIISPQMKVSAGNCADLIRARGKNE